MSGRTASPSAQFELSFFLADGDSGLGGLLTYRSELFDPVTAQRLARHFETLLEGAAREPRARLSELPLLARAERHQLLAEWNDTAVPRPPGLLLHGLFAAQAARTPDAPAVTCEGETLTYAALDARADRLARHLRELGCGPESRVGVALERSLDLVVSLLAVLKAGAAYVPLDPEYPRERLAFLLEDSRPAVLLTEAGLRGRLPIPASLPVVEPAALPETAGAAAPEAPEDLGDDRLAYVIYTSGSTGRPKGAMVHHRGICNRLLWMQEAYGLTAADTVLQKTPFSFDVSVWEFFWPLAAGARLAGTATAPTWRTSSRGRR
jgi:non-ribosomal peptide synthetase component F